MSLSLDQSRPIKSSAMTAGATPVSVAAWRSEFPILQRQVHGKPLIYLDNAATTLKPQVVVDAVSEHFLRGAANIHRGVHFLSEEATAHYELAREKVKAFIGAKDKSEIIFTSGTTASINLVALSYGRRFLSAGDEIVISHMEHHSNIVPWQLLCEQQGCVLKVAPINEAGELIWDELEKLVTARTKLVSMVYVSNSLGTINPVKKIIDLAHAHGAKVLIDAAQTVAHMPVDVQQLNCDFLAFSAHKLFGPTGVGVLYGKRELLEAMPPVFGGGDMIRSVSFTKTTYAGLPAKHEAGTPNIGGVIGLGAAIDFVQRIGLTAIASWENELLQYGTQRLSEVAGLKFIGTAKHKASILGFVLGDVHPHDIGSLLDHDGVAIRAGHHCTQPVMQRFQVPATARASLSFYNTKDEIDALVKALQRVCEMFV